MPNAFFEISHKIFFRHSCNACQLANSYGLMGVVEDIIKSEYMNTFGPDHATDIIENMVGGLGKSYYINTCNEGAVSNMSPGAFLEICCEITMDGIKPLPVGEMPRGIRGMQELVLDTHELTAEAVAERSFDKLRRAMLTDPLITSIGDADHIISEIMEQEQEALPKYWFNVE